MFVLLDPSKTKFSSQSKAASSEWKRDFDPLFKIFFHAGEWILSKSEWWALAKNKTTFYGNRRKIFVLWSEWKSFIISDTIKKKLNLFRCLVLNFICVIRLKAQENQVALHFQENQGKSLKHKIALKIFSNSSLSILVQVKLIAHKFW